MLLAVLHRHAGVPAWTRTCSSTPSAACASASRRPTWRCCWPSRAALRGRALPRGFIAFGEVGPGRRGAAGAARPGAAEGSRQAGLLIAVVPKANAPKKADRGADDPRRGAHRGGDRRRARAVRPWRCAGPSSPTSTATCRRWRPCWPRSGASASTASLNLGDIVSGPLWPRETAALSARAGLAHDPRQPRTPAADAAAPAAWARPTPSPRARLTTSDLRWLAALPATLDLGDGVWCCHGTPGERPAVFPGDRDAGPRSRRRARRARRHRGRGRRAPGRGHRAAGAVRPHPHAARGALRRHAGRQPRQRRPAGLRRRSPVRALHGNRQPARALGAGRTRRRRLAGAAAADAPTTGRPPRGAPKPTAAATGPTRCAAAASGAPKPRSAADPPTCAARGAAAQALRSRATAASPYISRRHSLPSR